MNDTPKNIKDIQLRIWLSKSPAERLKQFMEDNASLFQFWSATRSSNASWNNKDVQKNTNSSNKK